MEPLSNATVEDALRMREKELRDLIETVPAMICMARSDGSNIFSGRRWVEYTGLAAEDTAGSGWQAAVHPDDLERHVRKWRESLASGELFESEARLRRAKDGEFRWFLIRFEPLRDEARGIERWYGVLTDIEDRKRAEAVLREVQTGLAHANRVAALGQLTTSIVHEVSQPLAGVLSSGQAALNWLDSHNLEAARRSIERVMRDSTWACDIINGLRALAKKAPPQMQNFDLNEATREVILITHGEAAKNGVSVEMQLVDGLPLVQGDRVQLQQVILNLVINAIEAMTQSSDRPPNILIATKRPELDVVLVAVTDTGPGLAHPERIFEAFYTTKPGGLGMGLSICRSIVEAHSGQLIAVPNTPHGTTFQFTVQIAKDTVHETV